METGLILRTPIYGSNKEHGIVALAELFRPSREIVVNGLYCSTGKKIIYACRKIKWDRGARILWEENAGL